MWKDYKIKDTGVLTGIYLLSKLDNKKPVEVLREVLIKEVGERTKTLTNDELTQVINTILKFYN